MVVLLDLNEDIVDQTIRSAQLQDLVRRRYPKPLAASEQVCEERPNLNINSFSTALSCYPIVSQIARHLDLNSLHELSLTCRQFRANLLQNRSQLIRQTLHCVNEETDVSPRLAVRFRESRQAWLGVSGRGWPSRIISGKVGKCARDMVAECRRCGTIVCRNCTIKPPSATALSNRHRRLCRTCNKAPLHQHISSIYASDPTEEPSFTAEAFSRSPCTCTESVYLCLSCGTGWQSSDTTYMRGWTWRTRYSTYLGGLGTGVGEGNEGVECGKGSLCLAAREVEKEIDCDAEELAELKREIEKVEKEGRQWGGTSYMAQEIEGIGGVVKKKVKKRVKVGQVVKEYEDERQYGDYLGREQRGMNRSWCSWCSRIIPSSKDQEATLSLELENSSSSSLRSQAS